VLFPPLQPTQRKNALFPISDAREAIEQARVLGERTLAEVGVSEGLFGRDALVGVVGQEFLDQVEAGLG
jgi:hypothetical protein